MEREQKAKVAAAAPGSSCRGALLAAITTLLMATAAQGQPAPGYPQPAHPPPGAPNVLVIMADDVGFAASSTFGGAIPTPTLDALAAGGARFNGFHTTALCSPTRAALLTGRNPHSVGTGMVPELATPYPGYTSVIPPTAATVARILQLNGYSTAMFGKHHNTPEWELGAAAPATHKPNALGFDYFYGFYGGWTNQFAPALYENLNPVEPPRNDPGYILDRDLADHAIDWLSLQASQAPDRPFFLYYVPGTLHAPVQAPAEWIAKFRGRFDQGWDVLRVEIYERQKRLGIIPTDAMLAPMPPDTPKWSSLSADERRLAARYMEVYAAALAYSDHEIGRIIDELKRTGAFDHTMILFIEGDNGASAEGGPKGSFNYADTKNSQRDSTAEDLRRIDQLGGPRSSPVVPEGWTRATNTPFPWNKSVAYLGGVRNGMVVSWPGHIAKGEAIRSQFHHVIDIAPTILEAAHISPPNVVDGIQQQPIEGVSLLYALADPAASSPHHEQYFEIFGTVALYDDGWLLASLRPAQQDTAFRIDPAAPSWELYNLKTDFSQATNLAAKEPERLRRMIARFDDLAIAHNVYPISRDKVKRLVEGGRPNPVMAGGRHVLYPSPFRFAQGAFPDVRNRSWTITADLDVPIGLADGMIVTQGGRFGGWGLMVRQGRPIFAYRADERPQSLVELAGPRLVPGRRTIAVRFQFEGITLGAGGQLSLSVDGRQVSAGHLDHTIGVHQSEDAAVGRDAGTPLSDAYQLPFVYPGRIERVAIHTGREGK